MTATVKTAWSVEQEAALIEYFCDHRELWDPKHPRYYKRDVRIELLDNLVETLREVHKLITNNDEVKQKFKNLRTSYLRESKKVESSRKSDPCAKPHKPRWIHFASMSFLNDCIKPDKCLDTLLTDSPQELHNLQPPLAMTVYDEEGVPHQYTTLVCTEDSSALNESTLNDVAAVKNESSSVSGFEESSTPTTSPPADCNRKRKSANGLDVMSDVKAQFYISAARYMDASVDKKETCESIFGDYVAMALTQLPVPLREQLKTEIISSIGRYMSKMN